MKLILCAVCGDVVRLNNQERHCKCGECKGLYLDPINAIMAGHGIPLGFANSSFYWAINNQPTIRPGERFNAFVIEKWCPTFLSVHMLRECLDEDVVPKEPIKQAVIKYIEDFSSRNEGSNSIFQEYIGGLIDFCNGV